jgi:hypothetical protein
MKTWRLIGPSQDVVHRLRKGGPFGLLGGEARPPGVRQLVVLARRPGAALHQIGFDQTVRLHAAHQRVDGALTHIDPLGETARDFVGVGVAAREQREHAELEHAFLQLYLDRFRHEACLL